jgi:hypothetical protein
MPLQAVGQHRLFRQIAAQISAMRKRMDRMHNRYIKE